LILLDPKPVPAVLKETAGGDGTGCNFYLYNFRLKTQHVDEIGSIPTTNSVTGPGYTLLIPGIAGGINAT
jgi:hypothetical protein